MNVKSAIKNKLSTQNIQKFGRFLSGMVMPNIGAFIAWGFLTALFVPNGWLPDASLARLAESMIFYLLPLLIGYTGGKLVYGQRGGVLGSIVTMGIIVSTSIPMFAGAMIVGPLAALVIKKCDEVTENYIPAGFEMLTNNFLAGIVGALLAVTAYQVIGPVVEFMDDGLGFFVERVIEAGALPLISLIVEPAKILFLNNAINHGIFSPLGISQAIEAGKSIFFLLETNPGPGLGILLVYYVFGRGISRQTAPGAIVIHFFGGIHEIYFPYILMQPRLVLAMIAGGASGVFVFTSLDAGLIAVPSPGSIVTVMAMAPKGGALPVLVGVVVSVIVTFVTGAFLIDRKIDKKGVSLAQAKDKARSLKGIKTAIGHECIPHDIETFANVKLIAVACDAGMGSSAFGASKLRGVIAAAGIDLKVISCPVEQLDSNIDLVITHEKLTARAVNKLPGSIHISISDFIGTPVYQEIANRVADESNRLSQNDIEEDTNGNQVLTKEYIRLGLEALSKQDAIRDAGKILYDSGCVEAGYVDAMIEREMDCSTYIGNGVAIPHGTNEARKLIKRSGVSILQYPDGIDFNGNTAYLVIAIAATGDQHLNILAELAKIIEDKDEMEILKTTSDRDYIYNRFTSLSGK